MSEIIRTFLKALKPEKPLDINDWSDAHRILSPKAAAEPGRYSSWRTPYIREIAGCLNDDSPYKDIVFMKGSQCGASELLNNWLGYTIDHSPCPMLIVQPTVELAKRFSKQRVDPMIEDCPTLRAKVTERRSRDKSNTTLFKDFPQGVLLLTGANSAVGLRSMPAKKIGFDEIDAYPPSVDEEGTPTAIAKARSRTFSSKRKHFYISTPTVHNFSEIERRFENSDRRYYHVPCPHCFEYQKLEFKQLKWEQDNPAGAWYECCECGERIENWQKTKMLELGEWRAENPGSDVAGFHLNALYSPVGWYSWGDIAKDFVEAKGNQEDLRAFVNTVLGETWKEKTERPDWKRLYERRENYPIGQVPAGAVFLTAGVDIQEDRWEAEVVGWGRGKVSWSVDYRSVSGDPAKKEFWDSLQAFINEAFPRIDNDRVQLPLKKVAIDSGYKTQSVYNFVRKFSPNLVIAVKGTDKQPVIIDTARPVDVKADGVRIRRGLKVWPVGVDVLKTELYGWLRLPARTEEDPYDEPGYCHFPEYNPEFFRMLTAEELVTKFSKGYKKLEWVKTRDRNEALDCRNYARAAASVCGLDRFTEKHWQELQGSATLKDTPNKRTDKKSSSKPTERRRNTWL